MDALECLLKIGMTRQEAVMYMTLCREGELTGYEAAKLCGISRSNAYLALAGLVEKGGACRIESEVMRYTAVKPSELAANTGRQMEGILECIRRDIPVGQTKAEPYITVSAEVNIVNKMKNLIEEARERVYISMAPEELEDVRDELSKAKDRGLKVVIITSQPFELQGASIYRNEKQRGQVRLITDSSHVLTGELRCSGRSSCLYSENRTLVQLIKDSLTNEIKLIEMKALKL